MRLRVSETRTWSWPSAQQAKSRTCQVPRQTDHRCPPAGRSQRRTVSGQGHSCPQSAQHLPGNSVTAPWAEAVAAKPGASWEQEGPGPGEALLNQSLGRSRFPPGQVSRPPPPPPRPLAPPFPHPRHAQADMGLPLRPQPTPSPTPTPHLLLPLPHLPSALLGDPAHLSRGGRGRDLDHLGQKVLGKRKLGQSPNRTVIVCHFKGTPPERTKGLGE